MFKRQINNTPFQTLPKNRREGKHFLTQSEASITLISKPDKHITIKQQTTIPYEEKCKTTQQEILAN